VAFCRSCNAEIEWAETPSGKGMPLDSAPTEKGNLVCINGIARAATYEDRKLKRPTYASHFATCPDASTFRKAR